MKKHNFSAGPCILPKEVFQQASNAVIDFNNSGLSILEISHRSEAFIHVMNKAVRLVKEILNIPDDYSVLFLQGGASLQFLMLAQNFMKKNKKSAYLDTGTWASKAIKEALLFGEVITVASSKDQNYNFIPKNYIIPKDIDYFHCTSNNTIYGTQIKQFPRISANMVCDMSSDIFSRKIDVSKFSLIYAGAQKNLGPAGTTLVIIKNEILEEDETKIPTMLDYKTHIDKNSMFNTPPVFSIYVSMLTLEWLQKNGGIKWIEKRNKEKSRLLYKTIEKNSLFETISAKEDQSIMNVTFLLKENKLKKRFNVMCENAGISGIKGHRSVGGYRASIYNSMPIESVQILTDIMNELERKA